ncbi:hypothetical protein KAR91_43715 [Candidatus Pacearchaeota archaeon]|nr:hypothetical protein [Candidatus Pacearchaeota archaeon]
MMIERKQIDNLHSDIEQWFNDYQQDKKEYNKEDDESEWYLQLYDVFLAAYGKNILN